MPHAWRFWSLLGLALAGAAGLSLLGLQGWISWEARRTGDKAIAEFGGNRVEALSELIACESRPLPERNYAVWALGELGDRQGLAVLKKYHTQARCDHDRYLCQYELGKAIKKIERTWGLSASTHYKRTDPTSP